MADDILPAGAIQPEAVEQPAPAPTVGQPPVAQETSIPLSAVMALLERGAPLAHPPSPPPPPQAPVEVRQLEQFARDDAFRSRVISEISGGKWSAEDPNHVAMAEYVLRTRADNAQHRADMESSFEKKLEERFQRQSYEQQVATVQGAFEAELGKPQYKNLTPPLQQMLANNVGALVQAGTPYQQAISQSFASIAPLVRGAAPAVPVTPPRAGQQPGHSLAVPNVGAGKGGTKPTGRAGLNAVFANLRSMKS